MMLNANDVSEYLKLGKYKEEGEHTFLMSPLIANPQILGLIPPLQIRTFLRVPVRKNWAVLQRREKRSVSSGVFNVYFHQNHLQQTFYHKLL
jgi:hypothetical protein